MCLEHREQALRRLIHKRGQEEARRNPSTFNPTHSKGLSARTKKMTPRVDFMESEALPFTAPELHYHISHSRNFPFNISSFLVSNQGDPAIEMRQKKSFD